MTKSKPEPVILFRSSLVEESEMNICKKYFPIITQRSRITDNKLVIPRYSALPYYKELENDVEYFGSKLINSYRQHCYVADLQNWYYDLIDYTPRTWFRPEELPKNGGPYVLKGQTNSKKHNWNTHMFASNNHEAMNVFQALSNDSYISYQQIYFREFVPLKTFTHGIQGIPITEEYRFFVLDGKILSGAFYWSEHTEFLKEEFGFSPNISNIPKKFLEEVISIVSPNIRFFVFDVGRTEDGNWVVIELNDASMSGLSDNNPEELYSNIKKVLNG